MSKPSGIDRKAILSDLLKEKSLWAIYVRSRKIPFSKRNIWVGIAVAILGISWTLLSPTSGRVADQLHSLASVAFTTSIGLLGFLLAGFSFFATVFDKKMFCRMAETQHKESGLSYLKYNFFSFMRVFCEYFVFSLLSLVLAEILVTDSGARIWLSGLFGSLDWPDKFRFTIIPKQFFVAFFYGLYLGSFAYLLMQLNSFIFNIYHVSMSSIRWVLEDEYDQLDDNASADKEHFVTHRISRNYSSDAFGGTPCLDEKILIFEDRVLKWHLEIAELIRKEIESAPDRSDWQHAAFVLMNSLFTYFEMLAQYRSGESSNRKSEPKFCDGLEHVFPGRFSNNKKKKIYGAVRCGLYHNGITKAGVLLSGSYPQSVDTRDDGQGNTLIMVNPHKLSPELLADFKSYVAELQDITNTQLRSNFEKFFDSLG